MPTRPDESASKAVLAAAAEVSSARRAARAGVSPELARASAVNVRKLTLGAEGAPLIVVDDFVPKPDELVDYAVAQTFSVQGRYYPGIRCVAPQSYQQFLLTTLGGLILECLGAQRGTLRF
jgi:hypothetical protein